MKHLVSGVARAALAILATATAVLLAGATWAGDKPQPFLPDAITSSTVPPNGDLNPYGVAIVPRGFPAGGTLSPGDVLVSNFNDIGNNQGAGTTIVKLTPDDTVALGVPAGQKGKRGRVLSGVGPRSDHRPRRLAARVCAGRQRPDRGRGDRSRRGRCSFSTARAKWWRRRLIPTSSTGRGT